MQYWGIFCGEIGPLLFVTAWFVRPLLTYALTLAVLNPILIAIGWLVINRAEKQGFIDDISNKAKCKGGCWFDPYGLARDTADVPGKKTYYIVDSETNAIVDVKRFGKWGQKWLNLRAKRQAPKTSE